MRVAIPETHTPVVTHRRPYKSSKFGQIWVSLVGIVKHGAWLFAPLAFIQLALYVVGLRDNIGHWAAYWVYILVGVVLPGTALLLSCVRWRADWLTWLGLGWAVGHGCELVALLAARQIGDTRLCVLWVPLALGIAFLRRRTWHRRFVPLRHPGQVMGAFVFVCLIGAALFFGYNAPTSGVQVYKVSDMWFHISNAHAFRDSSSNPDPRVAGITLNYHMFGYAPSAAASAVTGESIANLLSCYAGLNMVFLTTLLLFNVGRVLSHGRDLVGVLSALLLLLPLDVMALFTRWWSFGTGVFIFATYNSPPTLAGYMALLALLLPVYWQYGQHRWQDGWVVTLLAFFGAGAKGVVGPLLVCAAGAVVVWQLIFGRHLIGRALRLVILMLVPIPLITLPLAFGSRNSVSSLVLRNNSFAAQLPYYNTLIALHWPDGIARGVWIFVSRFCTCSARLSRHGGNAKTVAQLLSLYSSGPFFSPGSFPAPVSTFLATIRFTLSGMDSSHSRALRDTDCSRCVRGSDGIRGFSVLVSLQSCSCTPFFQGLIPFNPWLPTTGNRSRMHISTLCGRQYLMRKAIHNYVTRAKSVIRNRTRGPARIRSSQKISGMDLRGHAPPCRRMRSLP